MCCTRFEGNPTNSVFTTLIPPHSHLHEHDPKSHRPPLSAGGSGRSWISHPRRTSPRRRQRRTRTRRCARSSKKTCASRSRTSFSPKWSSTHGKHPGRTRPVGRRCTFTAGCTRSRPAAWGIWVWARDPRAGSGTSLSAVWVWAWPGKARSSRAWMAIKRQSWIWIPDHEA